MPFDPSTSPFAAVTMIAAPAVLTNAVSRLASGTANRFSRTLDRARALANRLENPTGKTDPYLGTLIHQFERAQRRTLLLLSALQAIYVSLGSLAASSLVALVGMTAASYSGLDGFGRVAGVVALAGLATGVGALAYACVLLMRETRLAVVSIAEEARHIRRKYPTLSAPLPPADVSGV